MTRDYRYQRVYDALHRRLAAKEWPIGGKLPTVAEIQQEYGIPSLGTVLRAQQILAERGYLRSEHGVGVFVVAHPEPDVDRVAEATAQIDEAMRLLAGARRLLTDA